MNSRSPSLRTSEVISSVTSLCKTLRITEDFLNKTLNLSVDEKYTSKEINKANGKKRLVHIPHQYIRKVQNSINRHIFKDLVVWPTYIYGSIPNTTDQDGNILQKDYVSCARNHCKAKSILKMDISNFFDNIHYDHVVEMFIGVFNYKPIIAEKLATLCCKDRTLVQGALTSSYIASLILWREESNIVKRLSRKNLIYTRLVDDITVSSKVLAYDFDMTKNIISDMLTKLDLPINTNKTIVNCISTKALSVHGVRVNFAEPRFPADEVRRLRASVHNLKTLASQPGYRTTHDYRTDFARCMGRVNKLGRVNHNKHKVFVDILNTIQPLPSEKDLSRCRTVLNRLLEKYPSDKRKKSYRISFYKLQERLNVLQRKKEYLNVAKEIRAKLREIMPI